MLKNGAYSLGHVVAGSGMHRTRLDGDNRRVAVYWALIKISSNRIHRQMHGDCVSGNKYSNTPTSPPYHGGSFMNSRDGLKFYKSGRSTGMTASVYHGLDSVRLDRVESKKGDGYHLVITWVNKIATSDNSFPFADDGDSGSWITRVDGKVFGILTGGDDHQGTTYFCRVNDVFDDIKYITGAAEHFNVSCHVSDQQLKVQSIHPKDSTPVYSKDTVAVLEMADQMKDQEVERWVKRKERGEELYGVALDEGEEGRVALTVKHSD
ncbi:hypothetical protein N7449_004741 [Penicillium cf. viridicatum]|uniref:Uncharacterized protein n=1 Tax=Penicillium cf. viridicatum TaxID=2972119 RepID=A0A9W9MJX2_9EURO|nr:hypothetical protein N7449_004741 [Penicillium cf. viridicatum]